MFPHGPRSHTDGQKIYAMFWFTAIMQDRASKEPLDQMAPDGDVPPVVDVSPAIMCKQPKIFGIHNQPGNLRSPTTSRVAQVKSSILQHVRLV